jgi:hypothetical protein
MLAYLDPGTGSIILQAAIGAILGSLLILKTYWYKISGSLRRLFASRKNVDGE